MNLRTGQRPTHQTHQRQYDAGNRGAVRGTSRHAWHARVIARIGTLVLALTGANALAEPFTLPESPLPEHVARTLSMEPATELRVAREQTVWSFEDTAPAGFERRRLRAGMKVRGWRVKQIPNLYVGQARVGRKWGLGLVMEHGTMAFGMNHRGTELRKSLKSL